MDTPTPTSTDSNISSTFEGSNSIITKKPIRRKKYWVRVLNSLTDQQEKKKNLDKQIKKINKIHQFYLQDRTARIKEHYQDVERSFLKFKYLESIPTSYKKSADILETYYNT